MYYDLTRGKISRSLILFALPMIAGNLLQQFYNIADTLIVGRVLGSNALAAVGSSYTLMTVLTSVFFPLTVITGWYGMNFSHMPELDARFGYPLIIAISLGVIAVEFWILKKRKII